ncbi:MAG: hypothetical protein KAU14_06950, partial [Thermoplasmata archaeon]|nr:hypothetical protein [Thermoplasmata archaeon]
CFFEECDVLFDGVGLFRVEDHAIDARDSNLTMINSNLWNITQDAIHVRDTAIMLENVGIYNVQGDAIHLRYVEVADIINCTIDEDDPCYTNEFPFPPQYPGFGHGIMGHGIFAMDSHLNITGCSLAATEDHEIYLMDSTVNITDSTFKTPGNKETTKVHGIYMEDSTGIISNNSFNNAYRKGGFDLFGMETVPLNLTGFIEGNNFSDGRIFQQQFTLAVRVIDEFGSPVSDALVNLTDNNASNRKLSVSGIDGWISNPFTVPVYEIFRYTGHNNQTGEDFENFTNFSYNDHHLIVIKEYKAYNFNVSTELDVNITHTMTLNVRLNVSTPELSVKTAGIFPMVLKGGNIGITVVLKNLGERAVEDVNVSCYYALNDTQDWSWFGSDIVSVPDIFNGGNHSMYTTSFPVNAPLGVYNFKVVVDPENTIVERNETNNNYTIMDAFEVLTRPRIFIDHPLDGEIVNGTYLISGYAEDDYDNTIQEIELWID